MFLGVFCLAIALANRGKNNEVCAEVLSASKAFENAVSSWFPEDHEFNESCVSEGCPALNKLRLCPNDINITVLHSVLNTAVGCMREPICGILIDSRPVSKIDIATEELLPGTEIDGFASTVPGTGYLSNISNIEFEFQPDHNQTQRLPLQITMYISNMECYGSLKFDLNLRTTLPSVFGPALSVTIPDVKYHVNKEYVSIMSFNHSINASNFDIKLLNPTLKTRRPSYCGLNMPEGFPNIVAIATSIYVPNDYRKLTLGCQNDRIFGEIFSKCYSQCPKEVLKH